MLICYLCLTSLKIQVFVRKWSTSYDNNISAFRISPLLVFNKGGGDIGLWIIIVPIVLLTRPLIHILVFLSNLDWFVQTSSVSTLTSITQIKNGEILFIVIRNQSKTTLTIRANHYGRTAEQTLNVEKLCFQKYFLENMVICWNLRL